MTRRQSDYDEADRALHALARSEYFDDLLDAWAMAVLGRSLIAILEKVRQRALAVVSGFEIDIADIEYRADDDDDDDIDRAYFKIVVKRPRCGQ